VLVLLAAGFAWGRPQTPFYAVFMIALLAVVAAVYQHRPLSRLALAGLALWGLGHMVGGLVEVDGRIVYEWMVIPGTLRFDKIVHAFGFGFATIACFELLHPVYAGSDRGVAVYATLGGLGLGAVNEMMEFLIARYSASSNVGGFVNTGWDLVFNALGAVTAAVFCTLRRPFSSDEPGAGRQGAAA
jgi:putative membrane protein